MVSIVLTQFGDILRFDTSTMVTDDTLLSKGTKWHSYDCHRIEIKKVSETHSRVVCRGCGTLIIIPNEVDTYGKLRKSCADSMRSEL